MHLVTLSFDDGFRKSCQKIARAYESRKLAAAFNVLACENRIDLLPPEDRYMRFTPLGDFAFWNELQARGHEVMPHGYRHANKSRLPFAEGQALIEKCLDIFAEKLHGFDATQAVFSFPYNATTTELEAWLPSQVRAFRGGSSEAINPLPAPELVQLGTSGFGPGNCDEHLEGEVQRLLKTPHGWLVYCAHGIDDEGWGPLSDTYLNKLLDRLLALPSVKIIPAGAALKRWREWSGNL